MKARRLTTLALLASTMMFVGSPHAIAQSQSIPTTERSTDTDATEGAPDSAEIVVSASRISRPGFTAPTPMTSITTEDLANNGVTNVGTFLSNLPAFSATNTPQSTGNLSTNAGGNFLNLRNLGSGSTLVLINGLRHVPTDSNNRVDLNIIPGAALERIDVVTGGASAAWGSDAVAGVVNIVTTDRLNGVRGEIQSGVTSYGDNATTRASLAVGTPFAGGRGHVLIAGEYERSRGIINASGRDWAEQRYALFANPSQAAGQYVQLARPDVQLSLATENGLINTGPLRGTEFLGGQTTRAFPYGTLDNGSYMVGGGGTNLRDVMSVPYDRKNVYAALRYDLTDGVTAFVRGTFGVSEATNPIQPNSSNTLTIRNDNPFLPTSVTAAMATAGVTTIRVGRLFSDIGLQTIVNRNESYDINLGLRGTFAEQAWSWQLAYGAGRTDLSEQIRNNIIAANLTAAIDVVSTASGPACRSTVAGQPAVAGALAGCVPINIFGAGAPSAAARAYILGTGTSNTVAKQQFVTASLEGALVDLPGGPLSVAAGGEYRTNSLNLTADALTDARAFYSLGLRSFGGELDVKEVFLEASAPLLKDVFLADELGINGAVRFTDYSLSGSVTTWKVGATWRPVPWLLLRGTRSHDLRAPNLAQLFSPGGTANNVVIDPCAASRQAANPAYAASCRAAGLPATFAGTTGNVQSTSGGNPNLVPERAETWTAGGVLEPGGFLRGLRVSADYYDIAIADRIGTVSVNQLLASCYQSNIGCANITRNSAGQITFVQATQLNIARLSQRGIDFEVDYRLPVGEGTLQARAFGTRVLRMRQSSDGVTVRDLLSNVGFSEGGVTKWKATGNLTYESGPLTVFAQARYIGGGYNYGYRPTDFVLEDPEVTSVTYADLSVAYKVRFGANEAQFFVGANNLLDKDPPKAVKGGTIPLYTNPQLYDVIGRYMYVGLRFRL